MAPATTAQIEYIQNLLISKSAAHTRKANGIAATNRDLDTRDSRHDKAQHDANMLLARVWSAIVIPADLDQARASRWIEAIKNGSMIDTALDNIKAAAALGIADLIDGERAAIERAQKEA